MQRCTIPGGEVPRAEGDEASVRRGCMDAAEAEPLEVEILRVLEGHGADAEVAPFSKAEKPVEIVLR